MQALCVNDSVLKLGALSRINERCLDMLQAKSSKKQATGKSDLKPKVPVPHCTSTVILSQTVNAAKAVLKMSICTHTAATRPSRCCIGGIIKGLIEGCLPAMVSSLHMFYCLSHYLSQMPMFREPSRSAKHSKAHLYMSHAHIYYPRRLAIPLVKGRDQSRGHAYIVKH